MLNGMETKFANIMAGLQLLLQQQAQMTRVIEDKHARDRADMTQKQFENTHPVSRIFLRRITYLTTYFILRNTTYHWELGAQLSNGDLQHIHNHVREAVWWILACHSQKTFLRSLSVSWSSTCSATGNFILIIKGQRGLSHEVVQAYLLSGLTRRPTRRPIMLPGPMVDICNIQLHFWLSSSSFFFITTCNIPLTVLSCSLV